MDFFDFIKKYEGEQFIWFDGFGYSRTPENSYPVATINSPKLQDLIPFVIDIPIHVKYARFGGKNGTYFRLTSGNYCSPYPNENVYDFLKRDV